MKESIFRKKSIEQISSPDQLDDYIRVSSPGVWLLLLSILILLVGICFWGLFGGMDTKIDVVVSFRDGEAVCYLSEENALYVREGLEVRLEGERCLVKAVGMPMRIPEGTDDYFLHVSGRTVGEWVCPVLLEAEMPDGVYEGYILVEQVAPAAFVLN